MALDKNIKEWNFVILFKFNGKFDVVMSVVEILKRNLTAAFLLSNKVKVSSTYLNQMVGRALLFITHFSSIWHIKILAKTGRFSCAYVYAYVERVTSENCTRQISGFVLLMFPLMLMFMSRLFSLVLTLMLVLVLML